MRMRSDGLLLFRFLEDLYGNCQIAKVFCLCNHENKAWRLFIVLNERCPKGTHLHHFTKKRPDGEMREKLKWAAEYQSCPFLESRLEKGSSGFKRDKGILPVL